MKYGSLIFEKKAFWVVQKYLESNPAVEDYAHKNVLDLLKENMAKAIVLDAKDIPSDSVQLYCFVTVKSVSGWQETFQLVLPNEEDIKKNRFSVMGSLGALVIGISEGDTLIYGLPGNIMSLKIEKVKQKMTRDMSEEDLNHLYKIN